jgi:putative hydrolase of the HAD superfamily
LALTLTEVNGKGVFMINAIIFDFGRVISSQKPLSLFRDYENDLGLASDTINQIMFSSYQWQEALLGRKSATEFWYSIGPELGLKSQVEIDEFRRRYHSDESINTEVLDLLYQLHGRFKLAVLSNNPPGLDRWLADWSILELFDVIFCSGDEGLIKPDPAAYRLTLKQLGVPPNEAVFIDDTGGHVEAAQRLGLHGIVFTNAAELRPALNHFLRPSQF